MSELAEKKHRVIELDLPCAQCRYNLRGLDPDSCCPECGLSIIPSLKAYRRAMWGGREPLEESGAEWLSHQIDGVWFLLLSFAAATYVGLTNTWAENRMSHRVLLLCIAVLRVIFDWYGAWEIGRERPDYVRPWWRRGGWWLRGFVTSYSIVCLLPFNSPPPIPFAVAVPILIAIIGSVTAAPILLYLRLRSVARRAGATIAIFLMTCSIPFMAFSSLTQIMIPAYGRNAMSDSLSQTQRCPSVAYGTVNEVIDIIRRNHANMGQLHPLEAIAVAITLMPWIGLIMLLPSLYRARNNASAQSLEALHE